jgi:DNA-directed RNA polymerase subunit RPC12/RpoP
VAPDNPALESAQFSVICPKCGKSASTTVGNDQPRMRCPGCGVEIDLTTDEAKHARQAAAAKESIQTHQGDSG